jgi:hypothetical protein
LSAVVTLPQPPSPTPHANKNDAKENVAARTPILIRDHIVESRRKIKRPPRTGCGRM